MSAVPHIGPRTAWRRVRLHEVCSKPQYGWSTKASQSGSGLRLLRTTDITSGHIDWTMVPFCTESPPDVEKYLVREGDILISRAGSVGVSHLVRSAQPAVFASYLIRFKPGPEVLPEYLAYFLQSPSYWKQIADSTAGIAVPNVNASKLQELELPLAPLDEQARIVAELDEQFSRLDKAVANLKRLKANLMRYKAALLKAAVEGRLVPSEAKIAEYEGRSYETANELFQRLLQTRRARWASGRSYREPASATPNLRELPQGWTWATIESLTTKVTDGVHKKPNYRASGVPFVTVKNLTAGDGISFEELNFVSEDDHREFCKRTHPERGDLLVSKDGTLGVVRVVDTDRQFSLFVSVALIKPVTTEMSRYLALALESPVLQQQMVPKGSGLQHIHLEDLRQDCVPLPPLAEQHRIVEEVDRRNSIVRELEHNLSVGLDRATALRRACLSKWFAVGPSGLAPQGNNVEGSELRIASQYRRRRDS